MQVQMKVVHQTRAPKSGKQETNETNGDEHGEDLTYLICLARYSYFLFYFETQIWRNCFLQLPFYIKKSPKNYGEYLYTKNSY